MPPSHDSIKGNAVLFSEMTPPDGGEDTFNQWYDGHHTPNHVKGVPGFLSACHQTGEAILQGTNTPMQEVGLRAAAEKARSLLDEALGDTDLDGDEGPVFRACQILSLALAGREGAGV